MSFEITHCDCCHKEIIVDKEAHDHPFCVLTRCTECAKRPPSVVYALDECHDVIGELI